jgi:hypothetical protein
MKQQSKAALVLAVATLLWGSSLAPLAAGEFEWSGDIRVRNEKLYPEQRDRNRLRFRTGFKTTLNEYLEANLRFATSTFSGTTGGNNSTNQNFTSFNTYPAFWDMAYVTYRPSMIERLKIHAGKMKNFFASTPLLWDADTNPDGLGQEYNLGSIILRASQWGQNTNLANNSGLFSYQVGWLGDNLEVFFSNYVDTSGTASNYWDYLATYSLGAFKLTADYANETVNNKAGYWLSLEWNKVKAAGDWAMKAGFVHHDDGFNPDLKDSDFFAHGSTATLSNEGPFAAVAYGLEDGLELSATYFGTYRKTDLVNTNHLMIDLVAKF